MSFDVILTGRCDWTATRGPISGRLDLSHYRMSRGVTGFLDLGIRAPY